MDELKTLRDIGEVNILVNKVDLDDREGIYNMPKESLIFEKGYFTSDLKAEAVKEVKLLNDHYESCKSFPPEIRLLSDQNRKLLQAYIKWKNNLTEKDLEDKND